AQWLAAAYSSAETDPGATTVRCYDERGVKVDRCVI
ncbi:hypothetical protein AVEN_197997-1, partial [Araneus ventricosus]